MIVHTGRFTFTQDFATSQGIEPVEGFDEGVQGPHIGKWSKILGAILKNTPCFKEPWKGLVGNPQHRIGLPVLQVDVVAGIVFLYHVVFQDKGLVFVGCGDVFDGSCPGHKNLCFNVLAA